MCVCVRTSLKLVLCGKMIGCLSVRVSLCPCTFISILVAVSCLLLYLCVSLLCENVFSVLLVSMTDSSLLCLTKLSSLRACVRVCVCACVCMCVCLYVCVPDHISPPQFVSFVARSSAPLRLRWATQTHTDTHTHIHTHTHTHRHTGCDGGHLQAAGGHLRTVLAG
jgi:hypothetical protein